MHSILWTALLVLFCSGFTYGEPINWNKELDDINSKLSEISNKIMVSVERINMKVDVLNEKVDGITKEVDNQKSTIESIKKSLESSSGKEEIAKLMKKIDSYSDKQLKDQQTTRDALNTQKNQLVEIKNLADSGFNKAFGKLIAISDGQKSLPDISVGIEKLAKMYAGQGVKLTSIGDDLKQVTDSVHRARDNSISELEHLWKNVSAVLDEQSKPLSSAAASHVRRAVSLTDKVSKEVNKLGDLEPKLIHVVRLSEDVQKGLVNNDLQSIASNLTKALKALKDLTPLVISSVSKNVNNLEVTLLDLNTMSKHNDCPVDLTSEIRDYHNEIMKHLNGTMASNKENHENNIEIYNDLMRKFEVAAKGSEPNANVQEKLMKLRDDIADIRKSIQDYFGESEPADDVVFGRK